MLSFTQPVVRKGAILDPSQTGPNPFGGASSFGDLGANWERFRSVDKMKNERANRKKLIAKLKKQLSKAKNETERNNIKRLIEKNERKLESLSTSIEDKQKRVGRRKRWSARVKARAGVYSGAYSDPYTSYMMMDEAEGLSGIGDQWERYKSWWMVQNLGMQALVPGLFLAGSYMAYKSWKGKK